MQEKSAQAENELWDAVGEALDMEMSTVEDVLESLARTQKGNVKSSIENCMTILYRDPLLKDAICKNELTNKTDIVKPLSWKRNGCCITDVDMYQIQRYIETNYGISSDKAINKAVSIVASEKSYHPIRNFLEALQWDGKNRIASLLPRFLGTDDNEYTREIMRLLMLAAIHRIYEPGCKFEIMVCLVGGQGAGKSTFFRFLAVNDEWFTDDLKRMDDENVYSKMQGHWIIEMSEMLATANAKSIEEIKSFLSRSKEVYKVPYDTHPADRMRQCVFGGTSNTIDFLPLDRTGNRRFLPVMVEPDKAEVHILADEAGSREYIGQMWAEAMNIYRRGDYSLSFSPAMQDYLKEYQAVFMPEDTKAGMIQEFLDDFKGNMVCSKQLYKEALNHAFEEPKQWEIREINDIMNHSVSGWQAFKNPRRFPGYGRQKGWERATGTDNLLGNGTEGFTELTEEEARQMELVFEK